MAALLRRLGIPLGSVAVATTLTWVLWLYVQPSSTPLFFIAVMASSLYGGVLAGAIATCASTAAIAYLFMEPRFSFDIGPDDAFRLIMFGVVALMTNSMAAERRRVGAQQRALIAELQDANARIRTLSDLLPVCPHCKRVRTTDTTWQPLERYLEDAPDLRVSHALCPQCARTVYPEFTAR
jgi:K+-sensing histidine kinase KdpD